MQKSKMAVWEALQIAVKRREAKSKGEKERYKQLNAEFQRTARRDKKAFLNDQCKETEEKGNRDGVWCMHICTFSTLVVSTVLNSRGYIFSTSDSTGDRYFKPILFI